jgi:hypothetical protein
MILTGIQAFDELFGGLQRESIYLIAGLIDKENDAFASLLCEKIGRRARMLSRLPCCPKGRCLIRPFAGINDLLDFLKWDIPFHQEALAKIPYDVVIIRDFDSIMVYNCRNTREKRQNARYQAALEQLQIMSKEFHTTFLLECGLAWTGDPKKPRLNELFCGETVLPFLQGAFLLEITDTANKPSGDVYVQYEENGNTMLRMKFNKKPYEIKTTVSRLSLADDEDKASNRSVKK